MLAVRCRECTKAYNRTFLERTGGRKPEGWIRKTADRNAYERAYYEKNKEKLREEGRRKWKAKYEKKMLEVHGPDWKPKPRLTPEEREERKKARVKKKLEQRKTDPEARQKHLARKKLQRAVASGKVVRLACAVCGLSETEAHHPDYEKPLDVQWLCVTHHRAVHCCPQAGEAA
jgi:hypothetical protein